MSEFYRVMKSMQIPREIESMQILGLGWESFEQNPATRTRDLGLREATTVTIFQPQTQEQSTMKILARDFRKFNNVCCFSTRKLGNANFSTPQPSRTI
jgi:hypothetical protein